MTPPDLVNVERQLNVRLRQVSADLAAARDAASEAAIAGGHDWDLATNLEAKLTIQVQSLTGAIDAARARRAEAIRDSQAENIAGLRRQAQSKLEEAESIREASEPALARLAEIEAVDVSALREHLARNSGLRSQRLRLEARQLEDQARWLLNFPPPIDRGRVEVDSLEALIAAIYAKPEVIAPAEAEVIEWHATLDSQIRRKHGPAAHITRMTLSWRGGRIVPEASHASVAHRGQNSAEYLAEAVA